nr:hypothetical protein [uncultured Roseateles sp.]
MRTLFYRNVAVAAIVLSASSATVADTAPPTPRQPPLPTEWKKWNGRYFRLEADGHLSCYNHGGEDRWRSDCTASFPDSPQQKPLRCDTLSWRDDRNRKITGYEKPGHWCNTAYANLFAEWKSYEPLGFDMQLATTPRGDVMCKSQDGSTCLRANAPTTANPIDPLVCGTIFKQRMGGLSTGYDNPRHWCSSQEIVDHAGSPSMVDATGRFAQHALTKGQVSLKGWRLADEPTWIIRLQVDDEHRGPGAHLNFLWREDPNSEKRVADELFPRFKLWLGRKHEVALDPENRGTLTMKAHPDGTMKFFFAPGWSPEIDVDEKNLKGVIEHSFAGDLVPDTSGPHKLELEAVTHFSALEWPDDPAAQVPLLKEVLLIRKRPSPSP